MSDFVAELLAMSYLDLAVHAIAVSSTDPCLT
jgi:hypothetical protein